MSRDNKTLLADQMLLNIDLVVSQLMDLRTRVEKIKDDATKLQYTAGVSTPALGNGELTPEQIATLLNNRERTRRRKHS